MQRQLLDAHKSCQFWRVAGAVEAHTKLATLVAEIHKLRSDAMTRRKFKCIVAAQNPKCVSLLFPSALFVGLELTLHQTSPKHVCLFIAVINHELALSALFGLNVFWFSCFSDCFRFQTDVTRCRFCTLLFSRRSRVMRACGNRLSLSLSLSLSCSRRADHLSLRAMPSSATTWLISCCGRRRRARQSRMAPSSAFLPTSARGLRA